MSGRTLSFWGWGYDDAFPGRLARGVLARRMKSVVGFAGGWPQAAPRIAAVTLPRSRLTVPPALAAILRGDDATRIRHTYGRSYPEIVRGFRGDFAPAPDLVARPRDERDVAAVLEWAGGATGKRIAVVPRGGGTSVVGGVTIDDASGFDGVVVLDLRRLDRVLEVDPTSRTARIQAGATGPVLEAQLGAAGMTLRHFPQSFELSTLGGWIATRAGGHFATLETRIDDLVAATRTVAPAGEIVTRRLPGSGAGPAPDALVCGSEGTLGVVTEAWMRVRPRPRHRSRATVLFGEGSAAVDALRAIAQSRLHPENCRLLDADEARLHGVRGGGDEPAHVLLLACEDAAEPTAERLDRVLRLATAHGGRCPDGPRHTGEDRAEGEARSRRWREAFLRAPYLQSVLVTLGVASDTFETACPWDRLDELDAAVRAAVGEAMRRGAGDDDDDGDGRGGRDRPGFLSRRFTHVYPDGAAPYYTWVTPVRRGAEVATWRRVKEAATAAILDAGGTVTHHHAVGRVHRDGYEREVPELFRAALVAAKGRLDPAGILNPGALLRSTPRDATTAR